MFLFCLQSEQVVVCVTSTSCQPTQYRFTFQAIWDRHSLRELQEEVFQFICDDGRKTMLTALYSQVVLITVLELVDIQLQVHLLVKLLTTSMITLLSDLFDKLDIRSAVTQQGFSLSAQLVGCKNKYLSLFVQILSLRVSSYL